jgi:hypothetical protein
MANPDAAISAVRDGIWDSAVWEARAGFPPVRR